MDTTSTIIFCTDNSCPEKLFNVVVDRLKRLDIPIVSVSHEPLDLGKNICIGKQTRSWLTLYRQLHLGLQAADTKYIHIAEHDCLYSEEHFNWRPPRDDMFYYNENVWLLQWTNDNHPQFNGMFSKWPRRRLALSQLVCNRALYFEALTQRLAVIDQDSSIIKQVDNVIEPGVSKINKRRAQKWASSGRSVYLKDFLGRVIELEQYKTFQTEIPNIDVRHDKNFTGPRRGKNRTRELPYWGKMEDII